MFNLFRGFILSLATALLSVPATAAEVTREQIKSLDDQVQEMKTEALGIGTQMRLLEEKLLYPSGTQVALYVSMDPAAKFRIDSVEIQLDGKPAAQHMYLLRELEALQKGGVQRIYTGNIAVGEHDLQVQVTGKTSDGSGHRETKKFKFSKNRGPKVLEVRLVDSRDQVITLRDW